jgi:hypothetical chaperone protein
MNSNINHQQQAVLCVDFGTSHTLAGVAYPNSKKNNQQIKLEPGLKDPYLMRTLLYFPTMNECHYGSAALKMFIENEMEGRIFRSFKSHLPNKNYLGSIIDNRILNLETMIGTFLLEVKKRSEAQVGHALNRILLGKPARYSMDVVEDEFALFRMTKAAQFAGFTDIDFVPEPLAAALEFRKTADSEKTVLIGDFGGGTSDFTILKISKNEFKKSDVLAIDGCTVAGDAFDSVFMSQRLNETFGAKTMYQLPMSNNVFKMPYSIMERLNKPAHIVHLKEKETFNFIKEVQKCALKNSDQKIIDRLFILIEDQQIFPFFEVIEKTKKLLSNQETANFEFNYPDIETSDQFTTAEFNTWSEPILTEISNSLDRCLASAGLVHEKIDSVFLTGGSAHVPSIQNIFNTRFGKNKIQTKNFFDSILTGLMESASVKNHN